MRRAIIIGGGPAGSLAALLLARRAWHVTLVEQHAFPRDKVCGECLSALGLEVLARAGLTTSLEAHHPAKLTHASLHAADGATVRLPLGRTMWGLSRARLDVTLIDAARAAGARVVQPARCEGLRPRNAGVTVTVRDLATNALTESSADVALLADGKGALLTSRPAPTSDFGIKAHFTGVRGPRDAIALFGVAGHYGGVAPIEGDRANAAFSVPAPLLQRYRGDLDALFADVTRGNPTLRQCFAHATRCGDWLASSLPRFAVAPTWPANVIPLGNAAAALEPIGGEGMGLALRSAELAAHTLQANPHASHRDALRHEFDRLWRVRRAACRGAARVLSQPDLGNAAVQLLRANQALGAVALRLMGKSADPALV